jgi:hypothetical protein
VDNKYVGLMDDLQSCSLTLGSIWYRIVDSPFSNTIVRVRTKCCPPRCIDVIAAAASSNASFIPPTVYGSFPYHANSSVCLAAIHSGIITNDDGGWVQYGRFGAYHQPVLIDLTDPNADPGRLLDASGHYQQLWANISMDDLYPFNASRPSLSNGVQSAAVPYLSDLSVLAYSFVVYGRGTMTPAPAVAPFSGRSGHAHETIVGSRGAIHIIVGGRNATHYLVRQQQQHAGCSVSVRPAA